MTIKRQIESKQNPVASAVSIPTEGIPFTVARGLKLAIVTTVWLKSHFGTVEDEIRFDSERVSCAELEKHVNKHAMNNRINLRKIIGYPPSSAGSDGLQAHGPQTCSQDKGFSGVIPCEIGTRSQFVLPN